MHGKEKLIILQSLWRHMARKWEACLIMRNYEVCFVDMRYYKVRESVLKLQTP